MRLSVVFVKFGLPDMELAALAQLVRATRARDWTLRVVDNWGNPETLTALWDRVLREEARAGAEVAVLLNSDCWVARGWDEAIVQAFDSDPQIAVVGPQSNTGPTTAPAEVRAPRLRENGWPEVVDVDRAGSRCHELFGTQVRDAEVFGHCYAMRLDAFLAHEGLSPELRAGYTLYGSEQSLSRRFRASGLRTVCAMGAYCYHVGEASGRAAAKRGEVDLAAERARGRALYFGTPG